VRSRWVEYAKHDYDAAHINPGWHAWISYMVDKPPTQDAVLSSNQHWAVDPPNPNFTATRGNFATYNT
jgi:NADH:ubiquinone oxidoreductase subunit